MLGLRMNGRVNGNVRNERLLNEDSGRSLIQRKDSRQLPGVEEEEQYYPMKALGMVGYNPLNNGHLYHINKAKKLVLMQ